MKVPASNERPPDSAETEATGIPGLRTWKRVYAVVLAWFVVCVGLLLLLREAFR